MNRSKILSTAIAMLGVFVIGCQGQEAAPKETEQASVSSNKPTETPTAPEAVAKTSVAKPGMDMAEVKKLKGVPKETKHEHGPAGAELDIWVYDDETITFTNGKIAE